MTTTHLCILRVLTLSCWKSALQARKTHTASFLHASVTRDCEDTKVFQDSGPLGLGRPSMASDCALVCLPPALYQPIKGWKPPEGNVRWSLPRQNESGFLTTCSRAASDTFAVSLFSRLIKHIPAETRGLKGLGCGLGMSLHIPPHGLRTWGRR